jgi:hypothetical protein
MNDASAFNKQRESPAAASAGGHDLRAHSKGRTPNGLDTLAAVGLHRLSAKTADPVLAMVIASLTGKHRTEFVDGQ